MTHRPDLISEDPTLHAGVTYTARRNAEREPDGSWRWQVFAGPGPALVGYIQSHDCPHYVAGVGFLVFDNNNRPVGSAAGRSGPHRCMAVGTYGYALLTLAEGSDAARYAANWAAAQALPATVVPFDEGDAL